ncbi:hypothetical protein QYE76_062946 [Lolium multiflorum]|uniref:Uncharacterized protein n=1 Tax=Lolium multiflorum TaxID=4521 RepID=A0AAD8S3M4_LOLMU|nr:hypothetical protein QYE76_062946 [Lolium multiflorum]
MENLDSARPVHQPSSHRPSSAPNPDPASVSAAKASRVNPFPAVLGFDRSTRKMVAIRVPTTKSKLLKHAPMLTKNVTNDVIEGKLGRIYIPDQEIGKMSLTRDVKGLKRERHGATKNKKRAKKQKGNPEHSKKQKALFCVYAVRTKLGLTKRGLKAKLLLKTRWLHCLGFSYFSETRTSLTTVDPLQRILQVATDIGLLSRLPRRGARFRTSLYADDDSIFMAPIQEEISSLAQILGNFGMVTGLLTKFEKSLVVPIRCNDIDLTQVLNGLPATTTSFPLKYLCLPQGVRRLKRSHFQYLEDKAVARLAPLHGRYFNIAGRKVLVKSVLTSQAVYPLTALHVLVEPLQAITKIIRSFFWAGSENATGGKCKVNWTAVCRLTSLGGLGILNMEKFGRALRLRWPWLAWTTPEKPWVGMENPCNEEDMELFHTLTKVNIGDGNIASFWHDPWADGLSAKCLAPSIFAMSKKKNWNVRNSIADNAWVLHLDTSTGISVQNQQEFIMLWSHTSQPPFMMMFQTPSFGSSPTMEPTLARQLIKRSSLGPFAPAWIPSLGRLGLLPNASSSPGSSSKTGFGRRTGLQSGGGLMGEFVLFVGVMTRRPLTFSSSATSLFGFGRLSRIGYTYTTSILLHGTGLIMLSFGGPPLCLLMGGERKL